MGRKIKETSVLECKAYGSDDFRCWLVYEPLLPPSLNNNHSEGTKTLVNDWYIRIKKYFDNAMANTICFLTDWISKKTKETSTPPQTQLAWCKKKCVNCWPQKHVYTGELFWEGVCTQKKKSWNVSNKLQIRFPEGLLGWKWLPCCDPGCSNDPWDSPGSVGKEEAAVLAMGRREVRLRIAGWRCGSVPRRGGTKQKDFKKWWPRMTKVEAAEIQFGPGGGDNAIPLSGPTSPSIAKWYLFPK